MDYQDIRLLLTNHFKALLQAQKDRIAKNGPLIGQDKTALSNGHGLALTALRDEDYGVIGTDDEVLQFMQHRGVAIPKGSKEYALFRTEFIKAYRDYCAEVLAFNTNQDTYDLTSDANAVPRQLKQRDKKLADAIAAYAEESVRLKRWSANSAKGFQSQFDLLLEYLGQDASLHVTSDTANDVKRMLISIPKGSRGRGQLQSISLPDLMKLQGHERMSAKSISKYLRTYSTFFEWAVKRKETSENNFKVLVDEVKHKKQVRDAFTPEQVTTMLDELLHNTHGLVKKDYQKWGTLIALYTGARLNEVAQLRVADIRQIDDVWCFDFNDEGDDMQLKNNASRRTVPVHAGLIQAGLLPFVEQVRKEGKERLLHELTLNSHNGYGRNLSRWFGNTFLPKLGMKTKKLVFHSLRHTAVTCLFRAGVDEPIVKTLIGHALGGVTHQVYAKGYTTAQLKAAIDKMHPVAA